MDKAEKTFLIGASLVAPLLLSCHVANANVSQTSNTHNSQSSQVRPAVSSQKIQEQKIANEQPQALRNDHGRFARHDSCYWTNRINVAAYQRRNYRLPHINWNARDLGDYYAGNGMWTRMGVIYRGGDLHKISRIGIHQLKQHHINLVIDLRSYYHQGGSDSGEDTPNQPNKLGVKYVEDVVNTRAEKHELAPYKSMYGGERYKYRTSFLTWYTARHAYHDAFMQILNNQHGATYFHCIDGEDRTGIMAILYLSSLGVSKWHIYNDYLLTDYYDHKHPYWYEASQINTFYWGIRHYYGTMNNYLLSPQGVNLNRSEITQMRKRFLVNYR